MTRHRRIFLGVLIVFAAGGCSTLSFDKSAERWRDHYCLKEPLDRAACEGRRPGDGAVP